MKSSNIGGQAVLEGIMMKNKTRYAVAVRKPDQQIEVCVKEYKGIIPWQGVYKVPFIRGIFNFIDSLVLGMKTLTYSASFFEEEEGEVLTEQEAQKQEKQEKIMMGFTVAFSIVAAVGIFMVLPYFLSDLLKNYISSRGVLTALEGVIRMVVFLLYIGLISRMKDIQRTFMYHGAEHKCINCIEHGMPLTVENVRKSSRQHKRCGTSFLFLVMLVSICLHFAFVLVPVYWVRLFGRLLMVPVVSGISFEIIQWAGRTDTKFADMMSKPGLAMQKLTTKEPTADMVEVAIKAVEAVFDWKDYLKREFDWVDPEENNGEEHADI